MTKESVGNYKLTPAAKLDLLKIGKYTKKKWGGKQRNKYLALIDYRFRWLALNPMSGKHRPDIKEGYYCFPGGMHLIFYLIKSKQIIIFGVVHQNMDIKNDLIS